MPEEALWSEHRFDGTEQQETARDLVEGPIAVALAAAVEQPESLRIGHKADERPYVVDNSAIPVQRDTGIVSLKGLEPNVSGDPVAISKPVRGKRTSKELVFLHDLKIVHPKELYPFTPKVDPAELGVPASFQDLGSARSGIEKQRTMEYIPYMDQAMAKFADNDHKGCLEDLGLVLEQYPNDVNALFYTGLCSYNLGLYGRARKYLHRSAVHEVDAFREEGVWYHALALDRLGESNAAQESYARIVAEEGFYAQRARARMRTP
jgi:hypothetical protein